MQSTGSSDCKERHPLKFNSYHLFMGHYRKEKVNDLIRDEVGQILLKELDVDNDALVTVARAIVSEDGYHAKVYVSVLPDSFSEEAMEGIKEQVYFFQQILN